MSLFLLNIITDHNYISRKFIIRIVLIYHCLAYGDGNPNKDKYFLRYVSFFLLAIIMDNSYISRKFIIRINSNVTTAEGDGNPNKAHIVCESKKGNYSYL